MRRSEVVQTEHCTQLLRVLALSCENCSFKSANSRATPSNALFLARRFVISRFKAPNSWANFSVATVPLFPLFPLFPAVVRRSPAKTLISKFRAPFHST
jgi:hypothetical protein